MMRGLVSILIFLSVSILLFLNCSEEPPTVQAPPDPPDPHFSGTLKGILRGDGILVPNRGYSGFIVNLLKDGTFVKSDTTTGGGNYFFDSLEAGNYELSSVADFGYENIAYAEEFVKIVDSSTEKDVILDSLKFDFSPFHVGGTYTYYLQGILDGSMIGEMGSTVEITITGVQQIQDTTLYFFEGENRLDYSIGDPPEPICNWVDSVSVIKGYFKSFDSQVSCLLTEGNGCFFSRIFKAVHVYDGSEQMNNFLNLFSSPYDPQSIYYGEPFEINGQQLETLYLYFHNGESIYQFSDSLGVVYREDIYSGGHLLILHYLKLIDFNY